MALMGAGDFAASPLRFSNTRGRTGGAGDFGMQYPSPFFDIGQTYLPATVKQMFRWCRYYYLVNPLINSVVSRMAEYPITEIILDEENLNEKERWKTFLDEQLRFRAFQIEVGLDYYTYGNAFVSIYYPFIKYLICKNCKFEKPASEAEYRFMNFEFHWKCEKCGDFGVAKVRDHYVRAPKGIRLIRWNPEDIDVKTNDITGESQYYYTISVQDKNDIMIGKKSTVETVPQLFIDALRLRKAVVFSRDNIYHFKRPTLAGKDRGWGTPLVLPALKNLFYLQIMQKAQEAILLDHIVPLRVIFPQGGSATSDPYTSVNLMDWRDQVTQELRSWRSDNNYIPILPLPIGTQTIGGDGRALLLSQEIRVWSEHTIAGMGVPVELIFGGMSYSGSNVSLRMLENMHLGYNTDHLALLKWIITRTASYLGWEPVRGRFKPFKMADDLQRKAYLFQLNQAGKLSDESLLADADFDSAKEDKLIELEATRRADTVKKQRLLQAEVEGEASMVALKWQTKAQNKAMAEQAAIQNEVAKDQGAFQVQMQKNLMQDQMAMQSGQPETEDPSMQALPRNPDLINMPKKVTGPLALQDSRGLSSALPPPPDVTTGGMDLQAMAQQIADRVSRIPLGGRQEIMAKLQAYSPQLHDLVMGLTMSGTGGPGAASAATARPLPEQRPPRRGPEAAQI